MPACVARGCSSRYEHRDPNGRLKLFPRKDLQRRKIWIERVNRSDWAPTKFSGLCDKHFDRTQWEALRQDGKRNLKSSALPTVFCVDQHTYQDIVSREHSYCIQGYRQIYPDHKSRRDQEENQKFKRSSSQVQKAEVEKEDPSPREYGEDRLEAMETVKIKEERLSDAEEDSGSAEDIQCTPDIVLFKPSQPEPIEMVECDQEESSANVSEPSNDPLAISADDLEKNQKAPTFAHSKKFVFVTKETRYVSPMQSVVRAEPLITTEQPMVKIVKKPPRLFKAKELILYRNSSSDPSKPPKLQIAPNSTLRPLLQRPQIPSSTIPLVNAIILPNKKLSPLKLKLVSPPEGKNSSPLSPVMISPTNSSNRSDSEQKSPLKLSNLQRIKIISKATGKANLSSTPNTGQKKTLKLSDIHNLKFSSKPYTRTYEPAPEFLRPKKILLKGSLKGINKFLFQNSSFKPLSKQPSKISESSAKQALEQSKKKFMFLGSSNANDIQEPHNQVENESLEDGKQAKLCSQIFIKPNSQSNVLMKSKFSPQTIIKVAPYENNNISKLKDLASSGKSPVIILKPIEKSPPTKDKRSPDTFMRRRATNKILYKCLLCKIIFLTYTTLRLHMFSKHKMTDMSLSRNWEVLGSSGESRTKEEIKECVNVKWIRDSKTLDSKVKKVDVVQDGVRKCVLIQRRPTSSEDESTSSTTDRVGKHANLRKTKKLPGSPYSLSEKRSRVKNVVVRGQRQRSDDKSREEDIQEYKNDLLEIPNVNALKKSDDEFIRLTKLVTTSREKDELEPDDSSLMDNSERLSDGSSTISARDSLCKLSDDSGTLSAPETFAELVKLQAEQSKENNTRRPISRNLKKEKGLTAKQAALISRVTRNRKSENKMSNSRSIVEIKNDKPISSNLKQLKINLKKINVKNQAKVIQSKKESAKALAVERRSQRLRITLQVKKEDEIISTKTNKREKTKKTQIEEISSKIQIRTDIGNKRKPFNRTIVTKNKTKILPSESVETIEKVPLGSKGKKKPQESLEFACSTCSERFARRSELRKHVSTGHKIVKCFVCPKRDCSRKFESRRDMAKHARVHKK